MSDTVKALELLDDEILKFVEAETGFTRETIEKMDDDAFSDLYDTIADIEVEAELDDQTEKVEKASEFVTIVGNALYRPDDEDFDED